MSKSKSKSIELPTLPSDLELLAELAPFDGSTSLALASRIMLAKHTHKLYKYLPDVLSGDDPHAVHQMRVATRRLRASLQSTAIAYKSKPVDALHKSLRRLTRALGAVRDLDVLLMRLREDVQQLGSDRSVVEQRIDQLQVERDAAHNKLAAELRTKRTARMLAQLNDFLLCQLDEIQAPAELPLLVRHHAGSAIWRELEAVQRFETVMPHGSSEQLHELRISCKHLRYTLELFEPALGENAHELIKQVEAIQEHLGQIHDADVALAYFGVDVHAEQENQPDPADESQHSQAASDQAPVASDDSESNGSDSEAATTESNGSDPEAAAAESEEQAQTVSDQPYTAIRLAERARLRQEFAPMWQEFNTRETRRRLGKVIARL
ncbi:MAG TPA: CHAD domain-containing protein [Herpetosiphonaceae bacterium]